jgi:hypothetical protein
VVRSTPFVRCWDGFTGITTPSSETVFSPLGTPGGADALIVYLERAVQVEEQQNEQRKRQLKGK